MALERGRGENAGATLESWPLAPPARHRAVALVTDRARGDIRRLLPSYSAEIQFEARVDVFAARVETSCPQILIIDTDVLALPRDLCLMARSLRPDVVTAALVNHWSEREERLVGVVDAVLHKPPRREEWQRVFG
jgi:hypothetical protein